MRPVFAFAFVTLALGACTTGDLDGPDVVGVWRVTAHTKNTQGCTVGPALTDPPFIKFTKENLAGLEYLVYAPCSDATTCESSDFGPAFTEPNGNGYTFTNASKLFTGSTCTLGGERSSLTVGADGAMAIEHRNFGIDTELTEAQCTVEEARSRLQAESLPCRDLETLAAVRN